jgi:V/A-type H+-transporting ATPase subunit E
MADIPQQSSGVQELIQQLRNQGVDAGKKEAETIVEEAHRRAAQIVAKAKAEAEQVRSKARTEVEAEEKAAKAALQSAYRDTVLRLVSALTTHFEDQVRRLVSRELGEKEFIRKLILQVASQAVPPDLGAKPAEILLPTELVGVDALRAKPEEVREGTLTHFVMELSGEMLREGIELKPMGESMPGIRIRLVGQDVEIDLTEQAVADLLLKHLLPRYRAVLEGVIR